MSIRNLYMFNHPYSYDRTYNDPIQLTEGMAIVKNIDATYNDFHQWLCEDEMIGSKKCRFYVDGSRSDIKIRCLRYGIVQICSTSSQCNIDTEVALYLISEDGGGNRVVIYVLSTDDLIGKEEVIDRIYDVCNPKSILWPGMKLGYSPGTLWIIEKDEYVWGLPSSIDESYLLDEADDSGCTMM